MLEGHRLHVLAANPTIAAPPNPVLGRHGLEDRDVERQLLRFVPSLSARRRTVGRPADYLSDLLGLEMNLAVLLQLGIT